MSTAPPAGRPLLICDCDEVLLHMVVPFRAWLDEVHHIHFDFSSPFEEALRHKSSGDPVERVRIWAMLNDFFLTQMDRQTAIEGAVAAMAALDARTDIIIVTNIGAERAQARQDQLHAAGLPYPVIGNRGGKGPVVARLIAERRPRLTLFVDDLESNHASVAADAPQAWRLQCVGEPEIAPYAPTAPDAHVRLDDWTRARRWVDAKLDELDAVEAAMTPPGSSRPPPPVSLRSWSSS
jgi:hypothetical protein